MRHHVRSVRVSIVLLALAQAGAINAAGDLTRQKPILVTVKLGNTEDSHRFFPDNLQFETGKLYRLRLENPSPSKHYFSSANFSEAVHTRKVEVFGKDRKPASEVKGAIREIEVFPGAAAEWWFVPITTGNFNDLRCTVEGHSEAGMTGRIRVE